MFIRLIKIKITCLALVLFTTHIAHAEFTIDDYSVGNTIAQFTAGTATQTTVHSGIFGGERNSTLNVPLLGGSEFFGVLGFGSSLNIAQGADDQINGSFLYDNFGTVDLTADANFAFGLQINATDSAAAITDAFSIRLTSGAASSIFSFDIPGTADVPSLVLVDFANFGGIDLTNIDSIELLFDLSAAPGTDIALGGFVVVPEPSTALIMVAMTGSVAVRRRRKTVV